jgi:type III secretory pathway component EscV
MSEERKKKVKLMVYWSVGIVVIVFAAITAYIYKVVSGVAGIQEALRAGFPIWGITALAAVVICAGYYLYARLTGPREELVQEEEEEQQQDEEKDESKQPEA